MSVPEGIQDGLPVDYSYNSSDRIQQSRGSSDRDDAQAVQQVKRKEEISMIENSAIEILNQRRQVVESNQLSSETNVKDIQESKEILQYIDAQVRNSSPRNMTSIYDFDYHNVLELLA